MAEGRFGLRREIINEFGKLMAGALFVGLSNGLLLPVLPLVTVESGIPLEWAGLSVAVFSFAAVVARPLFGALCDRRRSGVSEALLLGTAMYSLGSLSYTAVRNPLQLVCLRAVHGIGLSAWLEGSCVFAINLAPLNWRATFVGLVGGAMMIATVLGPYMGEKLLLMSTGAVYCAAAISGMAAFLFALLIQRGKAVASEFMTPGESADELLAGGKNWPLCMALGAVASAYGCYVSFLPLYGLHLGISKVSIFYIFFAASNTLARLPAGRLCDTVGPEKLLPVGTMAASAGVGCLYWGLSPPLLAVSGILFGIGLSVVYPAVSLLLSSNFGPHNRGRAMVVFNNSFDMGIIFGSLVLGSSLRIWGFPQLFASAGSIVVMGGLPAFLQYRKASCESPVKS